MRRRAQFGGLIGSVAAMLGGITPPPGKARPTKRKTASGAERRRVRKMQAASRKINRGTIVRKKGDRRR